MKASSSVADAIESLEDERSRRDYLEKHREKLDDRVLEELRSRADGHMRSDPGRARALAVAGCEAARLIGHEGLIAKSLRHLGYANHAQGRYAEAVDSYEKAVSLFLASGDQREVVATRIALVDALMYLSRYDEALRLARESRRSLRGPDTAELAAKLAWNEGNVHHRMDSYAEALKCYERARRTLSRRGESLRVAVLDLNRAVVLTVMNEHEKALRLFRRARKCLDSPNLGAIRTQLDYNLSYLHFIRGRHTEALSILDRVRGEFEELGDLRHVALVDMDRSEILLRLNLTREAEEYASAAAKGFRELGMRIEEGKSLLNAAVGRFDPVHPEQSIEDLRSAADLLDEEGSETWAATARLCLAEILVQTGEAEEAALLARGAFETYASRGMEVRAAWAHLVAGIAARTIGDAEEALRLFAAALDRKKHRRIPWLDYRIHLERGRLRGERDEPAEARVDFEKAVALVEEMRGDIGGDELRTAFLADKLSAYEDMVLACLANGDVQGALSFVERSKSRALVDLLAGRTRPAASEDGDRELLARLEEMRGDLSFLYNRMNSMEGEGTQRAVAQAELLRVEIEKVEKEVVRILRRLELANPELASLSQAAMPQGEVVDLAEPGTTILEYFTAGDQILIFVVREGRVEVQVAEASASAVAHLLDRLSFQVTKFNFGAGYLDHHKEQLRPAMDWILAELHRVLIAPVVDSLGDDNLIVIPHGFLHSVPFHALRGPESYVIEDREVSYAPSADVLRLCLSRKAGGQGRPLLLGVPDAGTPHIRTEVEGVREVLRGARVLMGRRASIAALRRHGESARTIHLATHGVFREDNPAFSAIRLGDSWLGLFDIYGLRIDAELVTLSACETGLAKILGGDELIGLSRGFFYAGTPTLMVSLWRVNDRSTAEFMQSFYRLLGEGASPAGALRRASVEIMDRYEHPYFWAPFVVVGRPRGSPRGHKAI